MGSLADYAENKFLDHMTGTGAAMTLPSVYLAIGTGNTDAGITTEVTTVGTNYARVSILGAAWNAAAARTVSNNGTVTFNTSVGAGWGSPDSWAIYDAATGGNCLFYGDITTPKLINIGQTPSFAASTINCTVNASAGNVGMSTSLANGMLDMMTGKTLYSRPANLYVGFGTTPLTDGGTVTGEASGGGYARTDSGAMGAAAGGVSSNSAAISYTVSADWTAALDVLFISNSLTATTNASLLFFGQISSMSPVSGDTVEISIADLSLTLA